RYGRYLIVNKGRKLGRTGTRMGFNIQLIHNLPCFKYEWMREAQSARMPFGKNIQFNTVPASGGNLVDNLSDILVNIPDHLRRFRPNFKPQPDPFGRCKRAAAFYRTQYDTGPRALGQLYFVDAVDKLIHGQDGAGISKAGPVVGFRNPADYLAALHADGRMA